MSNRNKNNTRQQQEQFTDNCRYLGLKLLAEEYQQMVNSANENTVGYYEFISDIVQAEAATKQQRRIENLIKSSRLPQPLKPGDTWGSQGVPLRWWTRPLRTGPCR